MVEGLVSEPWLPGFDSRAVHTRSISGLFAIEFMHFKSRSLHLVFSDGNRQGLQGYLLTISAWFDGSEIPFDIDKCHVLQVRTKNMKFNYKMCDSASVGFLLSYLLSSLTVSSAEK